jgi:hypothetical protein
MGALRAEENLNGDSGNAWIWIKRWGRPPIVTWSKKPASVKTPETDQRKQLPFAISLKSVPKSLCPDVWQS